MTHSVPTRRSSDLAEGSGARRRAGRGHAPDLPAQRGGRGSPARPARCVLEPCPQRVPGDDRSRLRGGAMSMTDDDVVVRRQVVVDRSEEHTSELQSLMRISYSVFWLKKKRT